MPKILLVVPPDRGWDGELKPLLFPSLGAGYLSAYLKQKDIDVYGLDTSLDFSQMETDIEKKIREVEPDIIGVTVYSALVKEVEKIVRKIKAISKIPIVLGGPHISSTGTEFIEQMDVDYGVVMDGEIPLCELIQKLFVEKSPDTVHEIPGLIYKKADSFVLNPNTTLVENLDEFPFPDYTIFDLEKYPRIKNKHYTFLTSRGCPYGCTFCAAPLVTGKKFRTRSPENVLSEIRHYYQLGYREFGIFDDVFNLEINRAKEVVRLIIKENMDMKWDLSNGIRANTCDEEFIRLLGESGCTFVGIGMESGNDEVRRSIKKGLKKKQLLDVLEWCNKYGVGTAVNFIIGHPEETYETAKETLEFAESLPASYVNIYGLIPLKGTVAYEQLKEKERNGDAVFFQEQDEYLTNATGQKVSSVYETETFSSKQRLELLKKARRITNKKAMKYRLGNILGTIVYQLSKMSFFELLLIKVRSNRIIELLYFKLRRA